MEIASTIENKNPELSNSLSPLAKLNTLAQLAKNEGYKIDWNLNVSTHLPWISEELSHLYHTSVYAQLPEASRLKYNHMFALLVAEQIASFESDILGQVQKYVFEPLKLKSDLPFEIKAALDFFKSEER